MITILKSIFKIKVKVKFFKVNNQNKVIHKYNLILMLKYQMLIILKMMCLMRIMVMKK